VHAVGIAANPETFIAQRVLESVAGRLAPYMIPRSIELVDQLPTSPNGKIDYKALVRERGAHAID
jgi:acyl-CoA synthetase (AMP-forming)/AMP-acid ligase II